MHLRYDDGKLKRWGRAEGLLWFACEKYFPPKKCVKKVIKENGKVAKSLSRKI